MDTYVEIIIAESDGAESMAVATDGHDPGLVGRNNLLHDQVRKQEVAQMVRSKLRLDALGRQRILHSHDPRIVNEDVDGGDVIPGIDLRSRGPHTLLRPQVEIQGAYFDIGMGGGDVCGGLGEFFSVACCEDQVCGLGFGNGLDEECP